MEQALGTIFMNINRVAYKNIIFTGFKNYFEYFSKELF